MLDQEKIFWKIGHKITGHKLRLSPCLGLRRFKAFFGVTPEVCGIIWKLLEHKRPEKSEPKHLLWALSFLKQYNSESTIKPLVKADEKTIRKWTWTFVELISKMEIINFENRMENSTPNQKSFVSLDGVDFRILEPKPSDSKWFSHKFRGPGLRYEIGLCIKTGKIVWFNGGYPCGTFPDLKVASQSYIHMVNVDELTIADKGYNNSKYFLVPDNKNSSTHKLIMSKHDTLKKRLRHFKILSNTFRHSITKHAMCFGAVINITELLIENDEPLLSID